MVRCPFLKALRMNGIVMNKLNYQKEMERIINGFDESPTLFLHSCCAPCSSYVLAYLRQYFRITVFYYNPNIYPEEEFYKRVKEQERLIAELNRDRFVINMENDKALDKVNDIDFVLGRYNPEEFFEIAKGLEKCPEGGERCFKCYEQRLRQAAVKARELGYDYFTTTLSISPLKNADKLNEIGNLVAKEIGIKHLPADFKKREGYKYSIELSKKYGLYRQNYCGCVYSVRDKC